MSFGMQLCFCYPSYTHRLLLIPGKQHTFQEADRLLRIISYVVAPCNRTQSGDMTINSCQPLPLLEHCLYLSKQEILKSTEEKKFSGLFIPWLNPTQQ